MANRMDIELTSAQDDETYTWRAAGARQPRGVVPVSLLPPHCKVGDVLRAEVEIEIDGITILSVLPPREKHEDGANRIEYLGPQRSAPGVTTVLAGRSERRGPGRDHEGDGRRSVERGERRPRRERTRREGERPERHDKEEGERRQAGGERAARAPGPRKERRGPRAEAGTRPEDRERAGGEREGAGGRVGSRRVVSRFEPGTVHRDELFATLTPEQRPIAERLAAGGLPSVRKALFDEQQRARVEGRPVASGDPIVAIAEQLLPDVKAAVWLDRAEAAIARADGMTLRDLRTTVVGAAPRDEAGRELERRLREALERRVTKLRQDWEQHLVQALDDSRILQALRLSARPPEPTVRFPASLVMRLAEAAGKAMTSETVPDRWLSLLEAAVQSPVRRQVKPMGIPKEQTGEVERQARAAASRIPALGRLLGMPIPPPPQPAASARPGAGAATLRRVHTSPRRPTERPSSAPSEAAALEAVVPAADEAAATEEGAVAEEAVVPAAEAEEADGAAHADGPDPVEPTVEAVEPSETPVESVPAPDGNSNDEALPSSES
jgi:hypothetical protein